MHPQLFRGPDDATLGLDYGFSCGEKELSSITCKESPLSTMCLLPLDFMIGLSLDVSASSIGDWPMKNVVLGTSAEALFFCSALHALRRA